MSRTEILEKLKEILRAANDLESTEPIEATENSVLTTDLHLSSVNILFIVIAVEEEFRIQFDDVSVTDFETVGDVVDYIQKKLS